MVGHRAQKPAQIPSSICRRWAASPLGNRLSLAAGCVMDNRGSGYAVTITARDDDVWPGGARQAQ